MQGVIIQRDRTNPYENLAFEECLVEFAVKHGDICIFYLWQNQDSVILGRNQNLYREVNLPAADKAQTLLARRKTGGGAVFQDLGNLNYTLIVKESTFEKEEITELILKALEEDFGITADASGRNDLCAQGYKFSGNAYLKKGSMNLAHGTLMVNVNLNKMCKCLTPCGKKLEEKGIASVKSRVINLKSIHPNIQIETLKKSLIAQFCRICNKKKITFLPEVPIDNVLYKSLKEFYASKDWIFGSAAFAGQYYTKQFDWGLVQIGLSCSEGRICKCVIETDALITDGFQKVASRLEGIPMNRKAFTRLLRQEAASQIERDIYGYLAENIGDENEKL